MKDWVIYTGSYGPYGLSHFNMNPVSGELYNAERIGDITEVKYLAQQGGFLALACRKEKDAGICIMSKGEAGKNAIFKIQGKDAPCNIGVFEDLVITANYHDGTVAIYKFEKGYLKDEKILEFGKDAGCHQVIVKQGFLLIPCLKQDCIRIVDLGTRDVLDQTIRFPKGSGPRHGVWNQDGTRMWVVGELDNRLYEVSISSDRMFCVNEVADIVWKDMQKDSQSAAIRLSPDGRFLTVSTRGANVFTTWEVEETGIKFIQRTSCGGDHPRDFLFTPDGRFLLSANRGTGEVLSFERDIETGRIGGQKGRVEIKETIALLFGKE